MNVVGANGEFLCMRPFGGFVSSAFAEN